MSDEKDRPPEPPKKPKETPEAKLPVESWEAVNPPRPGTVL